MLLLCLLALLASVALLAGPFSPSPSHEGIDLPSSSTHVTITITMTGGGTYSATGGGAGVSGTGKGRRGRKGKEGTVLLVGPCGGGKTAIYHRVRLCFESLRARWTESECMCQ